MDFSSFETPSDPRCTTVPNSNERLAKLNHLGVIKAIGNTSLLPLRELPKRYGIPTIIEIWLKAEWENPGGSVKDRPALAIIRDALEHHALDYDKILIDATSGNTGIAYAMLGAALDIPVELVIAGSVSEERKLILDAYGANLIFSDPYDGSNGAIRLAQQRVSENPDRYWYADQYNNRANLAAHAATTAPELWRQTGGRITHLVAGLGTTGTLVGSGVALKKLKPQIKLVGIQPAEAFHGIDGLKHLPTAIIPGIYDPSVPDRLVGIETEQAFDMARDLARHEGLFVGPSTGAALSGALRIAQELTDIGQSAVMVVIAPDGGTKYLSSSLWKRI